MVSQKNVTDLGRSVVPTPFAVPEFAQRSPERIQCLPDLPTDVEIIAVGLGKGADDSVCLRPGAAQVLDQLELDIAPVARSMGFAGAPGEFVKLPMPHSASGVSATHLVLLGMGKGSPADVRISAASLMRGLTDVTAVGTTAAAGLDDDALAAFVEGLLMGGYQPASAGTSDKAFKKRVQQVDLIGVTAQNVVDRAARLGAATVRSRELCGMQSSVKTPQWLADQVIARAADTADVQVTVFDEVELAKRKFGGTLAVGSAAEVPPRLIQVDYHPKNATKHVVLVGKGVTFDTGGISLKNNENMLMMRTDMSGSAAVLEAGLAAADLALPVRVTTVVMAAENTIDRSSYRPSDVVTCYGGTTVEIANTDAEGRMVLADGLAYSVETWNPDLVIDVATLTGAATLGLGRTHAAAYSTAEPSVLADLVAAGELAGEKVWHMPLVEDYRFALESDTADISHIGGPGAKVGGGSIVAALFLQAFVGDTPWIHIDMAGPGRATADTALCPVGPTGYGARVLTEFLASFAR